MTSGTYHTRRDELERYFDRTAVEAWTRLTSDAPVSRVRATVRAGRDAMRETIASWLPQDLCGARVLDAGCGTGALSVALARRGANVLGVDVSPTLVGLANERAPKDLAPGQATFAVGDMLDPALGRFDYVVAMDSLIHYEGADIARTVSALAARTEAAVVFTIAPRTALLTLMHAAGRFLPRGDRAPSIAPISRRALEKRLDGVFADPRWRIARGRRIVSGFYISEALEVVRP
ncbi:Mg-protoporphyrin IX methyltransferase [Roseiarcus fermentans]|uniref:Magnesium protoporphyrin IX methyltransferase n=1 Tax=Roseiarcus fermentans TaxID=1473586 RepID=A0A366FCA4_9HYPH|nr:magnesium protoporphyrin IX methyltransferase [Roseiarcus fermentans]RBP11335.1 Mg-protoporphyrin IX methyltransferase [Roseiarcus fermentans]